MRYWLITSEYPPFFGGGIGTYCVTTAHMMRDKGHTVTVFIGDPSIRDVKTEVEEGIRVVRFNTSRMGASGYLGHTTNISYEFAHILREFIEKEGKPDCIESQEYLGIAYYLLQHKLLLSEWCHDVPVVITMHSPSFLYMEYNQVSMYRHPNYWICEMERFCLQAADLVISPSRYMLEELAKRFELRNKHVQVIPNPFDKTINDLVEDDKEANDAGQIVFFGKLTPQKGAFRLMAYFQELWDKGFEKPLFLIGGQDIVYHPEGLTMGDIIRKKYKSYISRGLLQLEDRVKPKEIRARLSKAGIVIVPSDNDNLPYVVFEMMALGKLLLVSKQGGQSEVIEDGVNGFVFDHFEAGSFEKGLRKAMNIEKGQRKEFISNGQHRLESIYSPNAVYPQKVAAIEKLISDGTGRKEFPYIRLDAVKATGLDGMVAGKLSIVVPYFNMGSYIAETMESLMCSEYSPKEILIINDGSTEPGSIKALDKYRNREGVRVIDSVNGGLARARNLGASHANGEFMAFLDADDTVAKEYYSRAIQVLKHYDNIHFIGCWVRYFENSKKVWPAFMPEPPLILYQNMVNSSGLVYRRSSFLAGGINDDGMVFPGLEDYESVVSMLEAGFGGAVIPETLFNYRVRSDSMIRDITKSKKLYLMQYISQKHKDIYGKFAADTYNLLNANGPGISQDNPTLDHHLADKLPFNSKFSVKAIQLVKKNRMVRTVAYKVFKLLKKMKSS